MPTLLIVDDEPNVLYSFRKGLSTAGVDVATAETGAEARRFVEECAPDAVILDIRLPDICGLDLFDQIREIDSRLPVIMVTAHSTTDTAIDAMKRGAFDYLLKPVDIHALRALVAKAFELSRLQHVPAVFDQSTDDIDGDRIVGRSTPMQEVYKAIGRVAQEDVTVLILGESGTGKELIARAIYQHGRRSNRPFLAINCAALPESLLESELFGHERGAFTGADQRRIGRFEQAHTGTLFLDEVGDMSPATQAKLLRVLQGGRFERVGGSEPINVDVRIVAATNQDLEDKIAAGDFRRDLFYRLNGFTIRSPALRDRADDLPLLVDYFLRRYNARLGKQVQLVTPEAKRLLRAYDWPGNVRELESVIRHAVVQSVGQVITADFLPDVCQRLSAYDDDALREHQPALSRFVQRMLIAEQPELYRRVQQEVDRVVLEEVLRHFRGNQVQAAERLAMSRTTLRAKLQNVGLRQRDFKDS